MTKVKTFGEFAGKIVEKGYCPIPIVPNDKRAAVKDWTKYRFALGDEKKYADCGIGFLCGQGIFPIVGIDADTKDKDLLDYMRESLKRYGFMVRVGNAPKVLYVGRTTDENLRKMTTAKYVDENGGEHQLEILANGQQFVGFGIHKTTGRPYEWLGKDPTELWAGKIKEIDAETLTKLVQGFEDICRRKGWKQKTQSRSNQETLSDFDRLIAQEHKPDISLEEAKILLDGLPASDCENRDDWIAVGMALHFHFNASDEAFILWDAWSAKSEKYKGPEETWYLWSGFGKNSGQPVTMLSVIKRVKEEKDRLQREMKKAALELETDRINKAQDKYQVQNILKYCPITDALDLEEILKFAQGKIKALTGVRPSLASVRGYLPRRHTDQKYQFTEDGNACRFVDRYNGTLKYILETGVWIAWASNAWAPISEAEVMELCRQTVLSMLDEAKKIEDNDEARGELISFCALSQKASMFKHMMEIAKGDDAIKIHASDLDANPRYVAVQNGEIDLEKLEFIPADPKHYITMVMGVKYEKDADCPLWKKTVLEVFENSKNNAEFYRRISGYPLLGNPIEQKFFTLRGGGANGKSTLTNMLLHVFGDYGLITPAETLLGQSTNSNAGQTREDLLRLRGKRFVTVMEPDEDKPLKEGTIKSLTGGESIAARGLYAKNTITFKPMFVMHLCTNHDLLIRGGDHGILRRTCILDFKVVIPDDKQDKKLSQKLQAEGPGVLNWLLQGIRDYRHRGLAIPGDVKKSTDAYKEGQDLLKDWLEDNFEFGPDYSVSNLAAFQSWQSFAEPRGLMGYVRNTRALSKRLAAKGFRAVQRTYGLSGRGFVGLRLKSYFEPLTENET